MASEMVEMPPSKSLFSVFAKNQLCNAAANKRWIPVKALASVVGKAQLMNLTILVARFYLRELHDVVSLAPYWPGTVRLSQQLKRNLEWWTKVPEKHNGAPIFKPVESFYMQCVSVGFKWGAVRNDCIEARGFWTGQDKNHHITFEELKAVWCAINSFLP
jgi:hypothetical protein